MDTITPDELEDVVATTPEGRREQALRRLRKRREFKAHAFAYVLVNVLVWGLWAVIGLTSDRSWWPWPVFITLGWGIGIGFNAWDVYFRRPITEDEVRREMEHLGSAH